MKSLNINLKDARNLCHAIIYANEQVMSSNIPVYTRDTDSDETYELNRHMDGAMCTIAYQLLNMFSNSITVEVQPGCISSNREVSYILDAQRRYMFGKLTSKDKVIYEDDDSAKLIYHR